MENMNDILAVILGGGRGTRLYPLTQMRSKPAVPVAGKYRLIDIPISNCINSGILKIAIGIREPRMRYANNFLRSKQRAANTYSSWQGITCTAWNMTKCWSCI